MPRIPGAAPHLAPRAVVPQGVKAALQESQLPGRFMEIRQAIGAPKGRGEEAGAYLLAFIEELKATGFVADALRRHGIEGAAVAPAGR
jgi:hypothetical protein